MYDEFGNYIGPEVDSDEDDDDDEEEEEEDEEEEEEEDDEGRGPESGGKKVIEDLSIKLRKNS